MLRELSSGNRSIVGREFSAEILLADYRPRVIRYDCNAAASNCSAGSRWGTPDGRLNNLTAMTASHAAISCTFDIRPRSVGRHTAKEVRRHIKNGPAHSERLRRRIPKGIPRHKLGSKGTRRHIAKQGAGVCGRHSSRPGACRLDRGFCQQKHAAEAETPKSDREEMKTTKNQRKQTHTPQTDRNSRTVPGPIGF